MTGKDLFGTLVRWTGLVFSVYCLFALLVVHDGFILVLLALGCALLAFAEEIVEFAYRKRTTLLQDLIHRMKQPPQ
jgi:hypothetical protein